MSKQWSNLKYVTKSHCKWCHIGCKWGSIIYAQSNKNHIDQNLQTWVKAFHKDLTMQLTPTSLSG